MGVGGDAGRPRASVAAQRGACGKPPPLPRRANPHNCCPEWRLMRARNARARAGCARIFWRSGEKWGRAHVGRLRGQGRAERDDREHVNRGGLVGVSVELASEILLATRCGEQLNTKTPSTERSVERSDRERTTGIGAGTRNPSCVAGPCRERQQLRLALSGTVAMLAAAGALGASLVPRSRPHLQYEDLLLQLATPVNPRSRMP